MVAPTIPDILFIESENAILSLIDSICCEAIYLMSDANSTIEEIIEYLTWNAISLAEFAFGHVTGENIQSCANAIAYEIQNRA